MADDPKAPTQTTSVQPPADMTPATPTITPAESTPAAATVPAPPPAPPQPQPQAFRSIKPAQAQLREPEPVPGLPAAFPRKRRGRPPGRPNMTVREADYDDNPFVQAWNAAKSERALTVVPVRIRDALSEIALVHESQRSIFHMPGREIIYYVQGWITARHVASQRPSYINGLLIHSRGQDAPNSCQQCVERRQKNAVGPFLTCRTLQGVFHNSCSNCKWFDNTSTCSLYTGPKPNRKRKAKEIQAAAGASTQQPNGTDTAANPAQAPQPEPEPAPTEVTTPLTAQIKEDTTQTPHNQATPSAEANSQDQDAHMGGTDDRKPLQLQKGTVAPQTDSGEQVGSSVSSEPQQETSGDDTDEQDANSVDAQLAAQLLPEINRDE